MKKVLLMIAVIGMMATVFASTSHAVGSSCTCGAVLLSAPGKFLQTIDMAKGDKTYAFSATSDCSDCVNGTLCNGPTFPVCTGCGPFYGVNKTPRGVNTCEQSTMSGGHPILAYIPDDTRFPFGAVTTFHPEVFTWNNTKLVAMVGKPLNMTAYIRDFRRPFPLPLDVCNFTITSVLVTVKNKYTPDQITWSTAGMPSDPCAVDLSASVNLQTNGQTVQPAYGSSVISTLKGYLTSNKKVGVEWTVSGAPTGFNVPSVYVGECATCADIPGEWFDVRVEMFEKLLGDIDEDGVVGNSDLAVWKANFGKQFTCKCGAYFNF